MQTGRGKALTRRRWGRIPTAAGQDRDFASVFRALPDAVLLVDAARGAVLAANPAAEAVLGPVAGRALSSVLPDRGGAVAALVDRCASRAGQPCEVQVQRADGGTAPMDCTATLATWDAGQVVVVTLRDACERQRLEEERAARLEMAKDFAGTLDLQEMVGRAERRTARLLPADVVATFYWDPAAAGYRLLSHFGLPDALRAAADRLTLRMRSVFGGQLADGQTVVVDAERPPARREQALLARFGIEAFVAVPLVVRGQVRGTFCAGLRAPRPFSLPQVDLLESIAHQLAVAIETAALQRTQQDEARYAAAQARVGQALISSLATPAVYGTLCAVTAEVLDCDLSHTFLWCPADGAYAAAGSHGDTAEEREALRVLRFTPAMTVGLRAGFAQTALVRLSALEPGDAVRRGLSAVHAIGAGIAAALLRGQELIGFHVAAYRERQAPFTALQERIARGVAQLASLALENARLVEELERANRVKSDFVATMSHELRTPLNVIIGYHDLLLEGEFGPLTAEQAERVRRAERSACELLDLVNATLDLGRLEGGDLPLQVQEVDLAALMQELDAVVRALAPKPGVDFHWRPPADLPRLRTDATKLKVILKNLIHNAFKFTDAGTVTVAMDALPGEMVFEVADSGIGIPAELQASIFEPFRQADSSSTRTYGGVGLGLYIVQRLVEALGGRIQVDSEVGLGSRFRVWIPIDGGRWQPEISGPGG